MRTFRLLAGRLAIVRLPGSSSQPPWPEGSFLSVTRTPTELSIVCDERAVPADLPSDRGWNALQLQGVFDLDQTGIAAEFTGVLARASVAVFVISTYDTDYVLVRETSLETAILALRTAGYGIQEAD